LRRASSKQLDTKLPEIPRRNARQALMRELGSFLGESGFSPQEVGGLTDHRAYLIRPRCHALFAS